MRIVVLTTETLHHAYFVRELAACGHDVLCLLEQRSLSAPYEAAHPFEAERDDDERSAWFGGRGARIADFAASHEFVDINTSECIGKLAAFSPDLVVTFGTGRLKADIIVRCGDRLVNLHGGDPEHYRGLDTHLWAIWHKDFSGLSTCLHRVTIGLDAGDIVACLPLDLCRAMPLYQLRRANTETCLRLVLMGVLQIEALGHLVSRAQRGAGRYYSFMPSALKGVCVDRFARYTDTL